MEDTNCDSWDSRQQPVFSLSSIPNSAGQSRQTDCSLSPNRSGLIGRLPHPSQNSSITLVPTHAQPIPSPCSTLYPAGTWRG